MQLVRSPDRFSSSSVLLCRTIYIVNVLTLLGSFASAFANELKPLVLVDGTIQQTRLSSIGENTLTFINSNGQAKSFEPQQMIRWGSLSEQEQADQVGLVDGSILVGQVTKISRTQMVLETDVWGELTLPIDLVGHVIWKLPTEPIERTQFRDEVQSWSSSQPDRQRNAREKIWLSNGDFLQGELSSADSQRLKLQSTNGDVELRRGLASAWSRTKSGTSNKGHVIGFRDGTRLVVTKVRMERRFEVDLACGMHLGSLLEVRPIEEALICYVRFEHPNVRYLSDINPLGHKHIPLLTTNWSWGKDRNVLEGSITSRDRVFAKGIGMHSTSRLAFDLPEGFDEFHAELSIDRSARNRGSVVFRLFASTEGAKWSTVYKSDVIRGGEAMVPIRVELGDARRIALVVDFAERGDVLDRANWIGARLVRKVKAQ